MEKVEKNKSLNMCLLSSLFVVLKMISNNNIFLILFLLIVTYGIITDNIENKVQYLIYFISWVYAIKFDFSQVSLFLIISLIYICICVFYIIKKRYKIPMSYMIIILLILSYVTFSMLISENYLITETYGFLINYIVIIIATIFIKSNKVIDYVYMYSMGLITSSLVRALGFIIPSIQLYIDNMTTVNTVLNNGILYTRFAGLDLDPNYYAINVLIAISTLIVIAIRDSKHCLKNIILIIVLSIFGIMSLSKMFLLMILVLACITFIFICKISINYAFKYLLVLISCISVFLYFYYDYFFNAFIYRFIGQGSTIESITTGRSIIWNDYIEAILSTPKSLLIGKGITANYLNGYIAHNMYLTTLYKIGIIGSIFFIIMIFVIFRNLKNRIDAKNKLEILSINIVPIVIIIIGNLSLDSFVMDFFPISMMLSLLVLLFHKEHANSNKI